MISLVFQCWFGNILNDVFIGIQQLSQILISDQKGNLYQEMGCLRPFLFQMHAIERFIGEIPMFYTYITMCQNEKKQGVLPRIWNCTDNGTVK